MKISNSTRSIIKGLAAGLITSCIINFWVIVSFYYDLNNLIYDSMVVPTLIITYLFLRNKQIKYFIIAWIASIFSFILTEILISEIGIIKMVFEQLYGDYGQMSPGGGFGMMIVYMFNLVGSFIGAVIAFVVAFINRIQMKNS